MKEKPNRRYFQLAMVPLVPLVVIGGFFWPFFGYIAIVMMLFMLTLALFRGRYYCGWFCAMGAFHERVLSLVSRNREMLPLFKQAWFRWLVFVLMMGLLLSRLVLSGGDPARIGATFVMMWTIACSIAIFVGLLWKPRSWCAFCPMATFQGILSPRTYRLRVDAGCRECGICRQVCPVETYPGACKKSGYVKSADCMRCGNCVENCPEQALSLPDRK
ncbi:4Fe-4S binding protein [Thiovibrio sp. JS02]